MLNFQGVRLGRPLQPLGMFQVSEIWKSSMELERLYLIHPPYTPWQTVTMLFAILEHRTLIGSRVGLGEVQVTGFSPLEVVPICEVNQQNRPSAMEVGTIVAQGDTELILLASKAGFILLMVQKSCTSLRER